MAVAHEASSAVRLEPDVSETAARLFAEHSGWIYGYCLRLLRSPEEAEDALQATYLNACRGLKDGVRPQVDSAWLLRIAQNVCLTKLRSSGRRARLERVQDVELLEETVAAPAHHGDELIGLTDALASLPDQQRRAILLREWQGLSYAEVAARLELTQSAVETLIFRARRSLAAALENPRRRPRVRVAHAFDLAGIAAAVKGFVAGSASAKLAAALAVAATTATVAATDPAGLRSHLAGPPAPPPAEKASSPAGAPAGARAAAPAAALPSPAHTSERVAGVLPDTAAETAADASRPGRERAAAKGAGAKGKPDLTGKELGQAKKAENAPDAPRSAGSQGKGAGAREAGPPPQASPQSSAAEAQGKASSGSQSQSGTAAPSAAPQAKPAEQGASEQGLESSKGKAAKSKR